MDRTYEFNTIIYTMMNVPTKVYDTKKDIHTRMKYSQICASTIKKIYNDTLQLYHASKYTGIFNMTSDNFNKNILRLNCEIHTIETDLNKFKEDIVYEYKDANTHVSIHWNTVLLLLHEHVDHIKKIYNKSLSNRTYAIQSQTDQLNRFNRSSWTQPTLSIDSPLSKSVTRQRFKSNVFDNNRSVKMIQSELVTIQSLFINLSSIIAEQEHAVIQIDDDVIHAQLNIEKGGEYLSEYYMRIKNSRMLYIKIFICIFICIFIFVYTR
jgi:hypothetical protein